MKQNIGQALMVCISMMAGWIRLKFGMEFPYPTIVSTAKIM